MKSLSVLLSLVIQASLPSHNILCTTQSPALRSNTLPDIFLGLCLNLNPNLNLNFI